MGEEKKKDLMKGWARYDGSEKLEPRAKGLMDFVGRCKTEREVVRYLEEKAKSLGAAALEDGAPASPGSALYMNWKGRAFALVRVGRLPVSLGLNFIISHADAPRVDVKQRPLYEKDNIAMFDCHYYGGIKKYQWTNVPLALHGEIHRHGETLPVVVGEDAADPVFIFPDLEPHIDRNMNDRKASETVDAENLDAIVAHRPNDGEISAALSAVLKDRFGLDDSSFASADLALVPAGPAREVGFDRGLVGAYGLDDRICACATLEAWQAMTETPDRTAVLMVMDKEEIGSQSIGGAEGAFVEQLALELLHAAKEPADSLSLRRCLSKSVALSADVTSGRNPLYDSYYVRDQQALMGNGVGIIKFSGSGGKVSANEARGEIAAEFIEILDRRNIPWQCGSFGRIDKAGGGTLARYLAQKGIDTVDCGPALLSMHSPFELASKADYAALCDAYLAFFQEMTAPK